MKRFCVYIFLLSAIALTTRSYGQVSPMDVSYLEFGEQLNRQAVFKVLKDTDGFAWMATRSVITRYDGRQMTYYRLNESEIITDDDGHQTRICFGPGKSLWAYTDNGKVYEYNARNDQFELYCNLFEINPLLRLFDIVFDESGTLWLGTTNGLHAVRKESGAADTLGEELLPGMFINSIERTDSDIVIVNTSTGIEIVRWTDDGSTLVQSLFDGYNVESSMLDTSSNVLWAGTLNSGILGYDLANGRMLDGNFRQSIPRVPVRAIKKFDDGNILVGLDGGGVYIMDTGSLEAKPFISESESTGGKLRGNGVYDIMVDGNKVWVATYTGGITIVNVPEFYELLTHVPYNPVSLPNNRVNSILEDRDGDLWFATDTGISLYMPRRNMWRHFIQDGKTYLTLCEDGDGRVWCGGYSAGTLCIDKSRGIIRTIRSFEGINSQTDDIYASFLDRDGNLWIGGLHNRTARITNPNRADENIRLYDIRGVNSIAPVHGDSLMFNTYNGFFLLDKQTGYFRQYFYSIAELGVQTSTFIYTGLAVGDKLWLGTSGGGLNSYDLSTGEVRNYSTYNGLPSNFICRIFEAPDGMLWISSGNGIFCFDPLAGAFRFRVQELPVSDFVFMSGTLLRDGRMAFGSVGGALFIDPAKVTQGNGLPNLFLNDFRVFYNVVRPEENPAILPDRINDTPVVNLRHNQNSFSVSFGAIDFYNPENYLYSYRLEGFDDWSPEGDYTRADYTNIPPGHYDFMVKCLDKNSPGHTVTRSVEIVISPSFWGTALAWLIYAIAIFSLVYGVIIYFRKKAENRRFNEKINFFVNVAHDIRTPLSLVLAPLNDLGNEEGLSESGRYYLDMAVQNSNKLYSLVARLMDFHKMEVVSAKPRFSPIDLDVYIRQKADEFHLMAKKKDITLSVELPSRTIFAEADFDKLNHILDNLISNAIKYTPRGGKVTIRLQLTGKKIIFEVEDNGIGINRKEHKMILTDFYRSKNAVSSGEGGSGIGLSIARRLAARMKGRLTFESEENRGSIFRLSIPFIELEDIPHEEVKPVDPVPGEEDDILKFEEERAGGRNRILIVEDNDDMRSYLTYSLSTEYRVHAVPSAEKALKYLASKVVDIVISDVMMDGMSGIDLARRLKTNFETSHLFVILLTASTRQESMIKGFEAGADDYITKPFSLDVLKMKLSNLLQTRQKIQHHYLSASYLEKTEKEAPEEVRPLQISTIDDDFLKKASKIVADNMANPEFTINDLCRGMAMSRTLIYEKLRAMTGQSPSEFIRSIRLRHSRELLLTGKYSISDVAAMTGFADNKYFSTVFKKYFGESPSKIIPGHDS